jgi:peptidoglycan/xylan/chitin deacetylase (PgdA/CDA1 family)
MLDDLSKQTDPVLSTDDTRRSMTAAELRKLASDDLIEIGSHTVTHPLLTELQISEQEEEIRQSKDCLEKAIGKYVSSFSYPYGFSTGYPSDTVRLVKNAGFERACANFADLIRPGGDSFYLPRLWIRNMNKAAFVKKLLRWLA